MSQPEPKLKIAIRGFARGKRVFEDRLEVSDSEMENLVPSLAEKHATAMANHSLHMIEVEFLDELDPKSRFFRFGTDPRGMVQPIAIDLGRVAEGRKPS